MRADAAAHRAVRQGRREQRRNVLAGVRLPSGADHRHADRHASGRVWPAGPDSTSAHRPTTGGPSALVGTDPRAHARQRREGRHRGTHAHDTDRAAVKRSDRAASPHRPSTAPPPVELTPEAGAILLRLARAAVVTAASGRAPARPTSRRLLPRDPPAELLAPAAAFVTLHEGGELRGCVGLHRDRSTAVGDRRVGRGRRRSRRPAVPARHRARGADRCRSTSPSSGRRCRSAISPRSDPVSTASSSSASAARAAPAGGGDRAGLGRRRDARGDLLEGRTPRRCLARPADPRVFVFRTARVSERDRG